MVRTDSPGSYKLLVMTMWYLSNLHCVCCAIPRPRWAAGVAGGEFIPSLLSQEFSHTLWAAYFSNELQRRILRAVLQV